MSTAVTYPHIETPPNEPARLIRVPRVRVSQIVADYIAHGWSPEEICRQHSYLTLQEAYTAMAYYFDHQAEIDAELAAEVDLCRQARQAAGESALARRLRAEGRL